MLLSATVVPLCDSVAQTALHPANVVKTLLQTKGSFGAILPLTWATLSRGAGAQFLLSLPNGALHFAVLEVGGRWWATRNTVGSIYSPQFFSRLRSLHEFVSNPVPPSSSPKLEVIAPFIVPVWYAPANNTGVIEVTGTTAHTATLVNPPAPSDFTSTIAGSRHYSTGTNRGTTARTVF